MRKNLPLGRKHHQQQQCIWSNVRDLELTMNCDYFDYV